MTEFFPERILPVSTNPPADFAALMDVEFKDIKNLVKPGSRKQFEARAKIRSFAIIEESLGGNRSQPGEYELRILIDRVGKGEKWQDIFPGIRRLILTLSGKGLNVTLRITKSKGEPIHLVPEGTPGATIIAVKRVDELGLLFIKPYNSCSENKYDCAKKTCSGKAP